MRTQIAPSRTGRPAYVERTYGIPQTTLRSWRAQARGPRYFEVRATADSGRKLILYDLDAVEEYIASGGRKGAAAF